MNQTTRGIAFVVAIGFIVGMAIWQGNTFNLPVLGDRVQKTDLAATEPPRPQFAKKAQGVPGKAQTARGPVNRQPSSNPTESLSQLTQLLSKAIKPDMSLRDMVNQLDQTKQQPLVVSDRNKYTGEMVTVRTQNPLPGTRYFHAQVVDDPKMPGKGFVQHIGFEFRKGPAAFQEAIREVQRTFGLGEPAEKYDRFVKWNLKEAYVVWIKEMDEDDLATSPFNAYSVEDKGTIRIVVEQDIHHEEG